MQRRAFARRAAALLALACAALDRRGAGAGDGSGEPRAQAGRSRRRAARQCVADPAFMRRNHMDLLKHQRNETVHRGVRDPRASLKGCIECHASSATGSVAAAPTDFCVSCHGYAAVKVDCFECHASKPTATAALPANHPGSARLAAMWQPLPAQGASTR